jgi:dynein heavy chain
MQGLEAQLLGDVVSQERPDIQERKTGLVLSMARDKKTLQDIENKILKLLSESEGNILDDLVLIKTLDESKQVSSVIIERLGESERTEIEIDEMRNSYRSVAIRGSILYFVIADLATIDDMYQVLLSCVFLTWDNFRSNFAYSTP